MLLTNSRFYATSRMLRDTPWIGYLFALGVIALALVIRLVTRPVFAGFPFMTFIPAIVATAAIAGWRAGLLAVVAGGLASSYFLMPALSMTTAQQLVSLVFYAFTGFVILSVTAAMHAAVDDMVRNSELRERLKDELEVRVRERTVELEIANLRLREEMDTRLAAEAQVRQLQKMEAVGQLTGGIAHDFNNMLAIIVGSLDLARRGMLRDDREETLGALQRAAKGAQRATELTGRLLAVSRQAPLDPQPLDPNQLLTGMVDLLNTTLGADVRVETTLGAGVWTMRADPLQMENALINLCVNSRDAMPDGGRVTLRTTNAHLDDNDIAANGAAMPGQYVMIAVTDTGTGMSPEILQRACDPFFTTKPIGKGTGLGLSQVYGFVRQSGGHVSIESELGQGTTVRLYIPRHDAPVTIEDPARLLPEHLQQGRGKVVLVVDDEPIVRKTAVSILRELNYEVIEAADAYQALSILAAGTYFDLLLTDVVMPDMNGRELAQRVQHLRPGTRVLYSSGYVGNASLPNAGAQDALLLQKPFTMAQLASKVNQALNI